MDMHPDVYLLLVTIIACWSEMLFLSPSFCLLTDPVLRTFFVPLHCRKAHDDGDLRCNVFWEVFLQESENDGDRTNVSIESSTRLN